MASASRLRVTGAVETSRPEEIKNYDVFLSHRGSDTKKNIVSFLHKELHRAGLQPFLDERDIDKGAESWNRIERAIKTSPVALVIFSKSFADSSWCLNELQLLLETQRVRVLPVFYKVKPSDLRNLSSGPFAAGFKKLLRKGRFKKEIAPEVVEKWKEHLNSASTINGFQYETNDQRSEAVVLAEIVQKSLPDSIQVLIILGDYGSNHRDAINLDVSDMKELRILICDHTVKVTMVPANLR